MLGAEKVRKLGAEYYLFQTERPELIRESPAARFIRWHIPAEHSWPCNPEKMEGFIEKAAQTAYYKFESRNPQTILVGRLDPGSPKQYYKALASNLRGRMLQVFDLPAGSPKTAEEQNPNKETLYCLVGKEGIYCGMLSPIAAGGLHPGGTNSSRRARRTPSAVPAPRSPRACIFSPCTAAFRKKARIGWSSARAPEA
jgi:hypothetical protein